MAETRKLAAILAADVVGYSRLAGSDEDRTLARLRALRSDLIDPTVAVHHGRVIKRTGDGSIIEFRSVVDAVRCAVEVQNSMVERNAVLPPERRIEFRVGVHVGDVVEESDGDLMGDGVNIAARLEGVAKPVQDQITERVVGVVEPSIRQSEIEHSRRKRPENLDAYDLYLRALPHMASLMPADARVAARFLEEALKLDPKYAAAHAFLGWHHEICFMRGGFDEADKIAGLQHARAALSSGTDDAMTLAVAALVIGLLSKDYKAALSAIERALLFNPSSAAALYWGALIHGSGGNSAAATAYANRAMRLSPFDPLAFSAHAALGNVAFREAHYDEAANFYAKAVECNPRFSTLYFLQAVALALADRVEEASPIVEQLLAREPGFRSSVLLEYALIPRAHTEKYIEGARLLGLPE
jgi:class 3 adenylate cyclase